jgi:ribosomal protein S18 acetylase RimI-like enzyme
VSVEKIHYADNQSSLHEVLQHLKVCDNSFIPALSTRVNLDAYALKIRDNAYRYEAWQGDQLTGLIAAYCNDPDKRVAFITSVSVIPSCIGMGVASHLMAHCIQTLQLQSFKHLQLEVSISNLPAIMLYQKFGFSSECATGAALMMNLAL